MILSLKDKIWWFAVHSRLFVLTISAAFNFLLPDHAADAFIAPQQFIEQETYGDVVVRYLFGGLVRWDAQYYMHIAKYGYTYENCLAFFPLFPLFCRATSQVLYLIVGGVLNDFSLFVISSTCINLFCFVKSVTVLYDLSLRVLRNERLAYRSCIFYCLNPASIFFSAPYSECLFACLTFYGMLKCGSGFKKHFSANCGIIFGLSAITRSNGVVNIGFIAYKCLQDFVQYSLPKFLENISELRIGKLWMLPVLILMYSMTVLPYVMSAVLSLVPFISYHVYGYYKYCIPHNHTLPDFLVAFAEINNFVLPGNPIPEYNEKHWCKMSLPFSYSYIQSHYWNVGFLRYYHWKQIPNFLLALPIVYIALSESYLFLRKYYRYCMYLGLRDSLRLKKILHNDKSFEDENEVCLSEDIFPYIIHALFLTIFSVLCAHVQVTTRLISSSCPLLYWFCAKISSEEAKSRNKKYCSKFSDDLTGICLKEAERKKEFMRYDAESVENLCSHWKVFVLDCIPSVFKVKFIHLYFISFMIVGTVLFSNFLPWT